MYGFTRDIFLYVSYDSNSTYTVLPTCILENILRIQNVVPSAMKNSLEIHEVKQQSLNEG